MEQPRRSLPSLFKPVRMVALVLIVATVLPVVILRWLPPPMSAFMVNRRFAAWRDGDRQYRLRYRWVDWKQIAPNLRIAVVASEDQKFPHHFGFDFESMADAWKDHEEGGRLRGASTISQQVAKNLFLWPGRSFIRKGLEAYFTFLVELLWSKQRILEVYLNIAEFGKGIFGAAEASRALLGKSPAHLNREEAATLAAVLPSPLRMHAERPSAYVLDRRIWILEQMELLGGTSYLRDL
jgi:monofunctional biosynthetic peptidoglycan transglycosylase